MADPDNEPKLSKSDETLPFGRGFGRPGTEATGLRGAGRDESSSERSRGRGIVRGSRSTWRSNARGGRGTANHNALDGQPMGDLLGAITLNELKEYARSKEKALIITECQYVSSYNWLDRRDATISVPGAPPLWSPPKQRPMLDEDSGEYFRDPNAARDPHFPVEPAIRAVFASHPDFKVAAIDIVGCGNRFYIELIGNTVFLVRKENSPTELIEGVRGYGHTFPEAYTRWEPSVKQSVSHQRVVKYDFAGLKCLVRCESDGYLGDSLGSEDQGRSMSHCSVEPSESGDIPSLLTAAESITVSEKTPANDTDLAVESAGHEVPQSAVFDLKTRSAHREIDMEEVYPRLWVSQTEKFIIAYHKAGQFRDIQIHDLGDSIHDWEDRKEELLHRFHSTLHQLIATARQSRHQTIEVRRIAMGPLQIRKHTEQHWSALPPDLKAKWAGEATSKSYGGSEPGLEHKKAGRESSDEDDGDGPDDYLRF